MRSGAAGAADAERREPRRQPRPARHAPAQQQRAAVRGHEARLRRRQLPSYCLLVLHLLHQEGGGRAGVCGSGRCSHWAFAAAAVPQAASGKAPPGATSSQPLLLPQTNKQGRCGAHPQRVTLLHKVAPRAAQRHLAPAARQPAQQRAPPLGRRARALRRSQGAGRGAAVRTQQHSASATRLACRGHGKLARWSHLQDAGPAHTQNAPAPTSKYASSTRQPPGSRATCCSWAGGSAPTASAHWRQAVAGRRSRVLSMAQPSVESLGGGCRVGGTGEGHGWGM